MCKLYVWFDIMPILLVSIYWHNVIILSCFIVEKSNSFHNKDAHFPIFRSLVSFLSAVCHVFDHQSLILRYDENMSTDLWLSLIRLFCNILQFIIERSSRLVTKTLLIREGGVIEGCVPESPRESTSQDNLLFNLRTSTNQTAEIQ